MVCIMINKDNSKCNSFIELAEHILPRNIVDKFKNEQDRQYRSSTYFEHKNLLDKSVRRK